MYCDGFPHRIWSAIFYTIKEILGGRLWCNQINLAPPQFIPMIFSNGDHRFKLSKHPKSLTGGNRLGTQNVTRVLQRRNTFCRSFFSKFFFANKI
jgi:hypothetical protein